MSEHLRDSEALNSSTNGLGHEVASILADPMLAKDCLGKYTLISLVREYIGLFDSTTKTTYLYHLMGKDPIEIARLIGITSGQAIRARYSLINGFYQYAVERLSSGGIDIEKSEEYVDCMQANAKMDDGQIAAAFEEDMLTTKIMKHFVRKAGMVHNFLAGFLSMDAMDIIIFINLI